MTLPGHSKGVPVPNFRRSSYAPHRVYNDQHRFEHWYRDNQVYFITARCRDRYPAFRTEAAKAIYWDRFAYYTKLYELTPSLPRSSTTTTKPMATSGRVKHLGR